MRDRGVQAAAILPSCSVGRALTSDTRIAAYRERLQTARRGVQRRAGGWGSELRRARLGASGTPCSEAETAQLRESCARMRKGLSRAKLLGA
jgi:hypothetical protein